MGLACVHMQFCDSKPKSERWIDMSSSTFAQENNKKNLSVVPAKNTQYAITMENCEKYLTMANVRSKDKEATAFKDQLVGSGMAGFTMLNEYLKKYVDDSERAPVAIGLMLKMYSKNINLAQTMESTISNNLSSKDAGTFRAGCELLYHMIRKFPPEENEGPLSPLYTVDYEKLIGILMEISKNKNDPRKEIADKYLLDISTLKNQLSK
ncbi:MAG: hypothetical protein QXS93_03230 [Candidatus Micrarchaeia archaeon]